MQLYRRGPYFHFMRTDDIGIGFGVVITPYRKDLQIAVQILCWSVAFGIAL